MTAGCQPLMGYNYGSGNFKRLKQLIKSGTVITTAIELCIMAVLVYCTGTDWYFYRIRGSHPNRNGDAEGIYVDAAICGSHFYCEKYL